jgi:hypothetical protein
MSGMTIDPHYRASPMLIVPSAAGFAEVFSPFWREEKMLTRVEADWDRRWQAEWDRRNVED